MEDLEAAPGSPALQDTEEPQGNNDPGDPLAPGIEEESREETPPFADPTADTEAYDQTPGATRNSNNDDEEEEGDVGLDDDDESELEELDEKEFEDFDADALNIPDKPVQVDADNVGLLGVHKRKRTEEEERERKKKKKEGRREKTRRPRKATDEGFEGVEEVNGRRSRKDGRPKAARRAATPENEDDLDPEERRRRALDRKMDAALKGHRTVRRKGVVDLEAMADQEIDMMRQRMAKACEADAEARARGQVATHKLAILPQVVELMNRNTIQAQLVDPDVNILEAVRFMLEPADHDAALPNYQIQRELFAILSKLNIGKDALVASGIGKVVLFYTKSIQPQPDIKRQAEKLIGEWMRVVLKKDKTMRNRAVETRVYDGTPGGHAASAGPGGTNATGVDKAAITAERRRKALANPTNRMRYDPGGLTTYTVAPVNALTSRLAGEQPRGTGDDTFKRIAARGAVNAANRG